VARVLVVDLTPGGNHARTGVIARRLRDGGHEVVLAGPGVTADEVAAAAVQEDAVAIAVPLGDSSGAASVADRLAAYAADDIVVFAAD
jgi:methylmalonyl-CoA mutase cobalamin-binding subunit